MPLYTPFWRPFSKKGGLFQSYTRYIFENIRVNRHTGVYVSFFGNIFQIAYCYVHHTMVRVNRHTGVYVSFFGNIFSDSTLLRALHNGGHNLAGCCGNLF